MKAGLDTLGETGPLIIVCGRFLPGLRFVVNATMGLIEFPYRRFLLWSAIGGTLWATTASLLSYAVAVSLDEYPVAAILISGVATTVLVGGGLFLGIRHARKQHLAAD